MERNAIALGDLTDEQEAAALGVMEAALSDQGYEELAGIRESDNYVSALQASGGASGGGGRGAGMAVSFGEDLYYLAFFGEPSETSSSWSSTAATMRRTTSPTRGKT